jgi:HEAT repeat protein
VSAIARAFIAFGARSIPYVELLLDDPSADSRFFGVLVAGEIAHASLAAALVPRTLDEDEGVRTAALSVLPALREHRRDWDAALIDLRVTAKRLTRDAVRRRRALEALGQLREPTALPIFIDALDDSDWPIAEAAHRALIGLVGVDLGTSAADWSAWVSTHGAKHRVEWLIDALMGAEPTLRADASEALKALTQQYLGYRPDAPASERERVRQKYLAWWEHEGRARFFA